MIYEILLGMHRTKKYSLQQLSDMSGIAYTTLRDNIEENKK
jgi:hypothetical protein